MFRINHSVFDVFTIAHAVMPFCIGRALGRPTRMTFRGALLVLLAIIVACEVFEKAVARSGVRTFDESVVNIVGDVVVGIVCGVIGLRRSLVEKVRRRERAAARAASGFLRARPAADATPPSPMPHRVRPARRGPAPPPPRKHLAAAIALGLLGALRAASDVLSDVSPGWWEILAGTPLRYVVRAPDDGTVAGSLNVQFFKVLAIPCGVCWLYLAMRLMATDRRQAQRGWESRTTRVVGLGALLVMATLMEIEKATHVFGLTMAGLLPGEVAWVNHALHLLSAGLGFLLMRWLRFTGDEADGEPAGPLTAG